MSIACVKVVNTSKNFGKKRVINDLSLTVNAGEILGIIGPNGAGKTTLLRMIATLLVPTTGQIYILGTNTHQAGSNIRKNIGYMPEDAGHYLKLNAFENLEFYLSFYCSYKIEGIIENYLRKFDLLNNKNLPVGKFSQGMKRKLLFIRSILHDPTIILLDEPFISMDPGTCLICIQFLKKLRDLKRKCILISSHSLTELEKICDRILFISNGKKVLDDNVEILRKNYKNPTINNLEDLYLTLIKK